MDLVVVGARRVDEALLKQRHQVFVGLLSVLDGAVVTAAAGAAWAGRNFMNAQPLLSSNWRDFLWPQPIAVQVPVTILCLTLLRLYRPRRDRAFYDEFVQIVKLGGLATILSLAALYALASPFLSAPESKWQLALFGLLVIVFMSVHRMIFRIALRAVRRRGWNLRHAAIIGTGRLGQITAHTLMRNSWTGLNVQYFISHHPTTRRTDLLGHPVRGGVDAMEKTLDEHPVDAVYLALPGSHAAVLPQLLARLERFTVDVRIIPDVNPKYTPFSTTISELDGMPILSCRESRLEGLGGWAKRVIDIVGAVVALLIFAVPMLIIAILIRLTSNGPVMFRQNRVSLAGHQFRIYKFRTMQHVADEQGLPFAGGDENGWTRRNDVRVTPIGRWLRATSLDELPQLFNVLGGEMSLVGPRPERPELVGKFRHDWRGYMLRQHVKAGMTGWAQVNGLRGQTSLRKRLQYDLFYIRNWSLMFDVRILWMTLFKGFVNPNAH
ncbi:MAG: undecaprenyl-phosphate glucose phosphotransferase [Phycisphaerales bacterium]|nr:undecaprenyl-phosphate glucose phosphotransferase [Phycisphaerales bacterium]